MLSWSVLQVANIKEYFGKAHRFNSSEDGSLYKNCWVREVFKECHPIKMIREQIIFESKRY